MDASRLPAHIIRALLGTGADSEATSPNLLCGFLRIRGGESLQTKHVATSQAFFVIRWRTRPPIEMHARHVGTKGSAL